MSWLDSSFCQLGSHGDCDGQVHWVPVGIDGKDYRDVRERARPPDLRPVTCTCRCHGALSRQARRDAGGSSS